MQRFKFTMRRSWDGPDEPIPDTDLCLIPVPAVSHGPISREIGEQDADKRAKHAAYNREWRKTHPLTAEQRRKDSCRSYAGVYLRRGKLVRWPCLVCGAAAQMHHPDYSQPLKIVWLCRKHHGDLHKMGV